MTLHIYTPQPISLPSINSPDKLFPAARRPAHPDTMGENNTLTALKGCGVKTRLVGFIAINLGGVRLMGHVHNYVEYGNLKRAIAQLCNELQVCNFTML